MDDADYLKSIALYYDREAASYQHRQSSNKTLQNIRNDFRILGEKYMTGKYILDLGCGVGEDLCFFARKFPKRKFTGLDISVEMINETNSKVNKFQLDNVQCRVGLIQDLEDTTFDFIYVFFGALNTTPDLNETIENIYNRLNVDGKILVTFVNKWYPMGMISYLRRLKFKKVFERLKKTWWGYSDKFRIPGKLYYGREILSTFKRFRLVFKRGYSIAYPAWYQDRITQKLGKFAHILWKLDRLLSTLPFWSWGEYVLYVFEKK